MGNISMYKKKVRIGVVKPYKNTAVDFLKLMYMDKYITEVEVPMPRTFEGNPTIEGFESAFWLAIDRLKELFEKENIIIDGKLNPDYEYYLLSIDDIDEE